MPFRQLFILNNKLIGEAPRGGILIHASSAEPLSLLWFCQHCGDVYARAPVYRPDNTLTPWQSFRATCQKCAASQTYYSEFPGSLWLAWDTEYLSALPEAVLQHEFSVAADSYDRFGGYKS